MVEKKIKIINRNYWKKEILLLAKGVAEAIWGATQGKFTWWLETVWVGGGFVVWLLRLLWDSVVLGLSWGRVVGWLWWWCSVSGLSWWSLVVGWSRSWVVRLTASWQSVTFEAWVVVPRIVLTIIVVSVVVVATTEGSWTLVVLGSGWSWSTSGVWGRCWGNWQVVTTGYESEQKK